MVRLPSTTTRQFLSESFRREPFGETSPSAKGREAGRGFELFERGDLKKIDYKKELKHLYNSSDKKIDVIDVPAMNFLLIDGRGDPNTSKEYQDTVETLYALSYALKFMIKKSKLKIDYGVLPLEGLWWTEDMSKFSVGNKKDWKWTSMIMQPEYITEGLFNEAVDQVRKKKGLPALSKVRFEVFAEGNAAQIMHTGPFSEESPTIDKVHDFIKTNNFKLAGKHHEIYLSDIRKASSDKWKTIIRQPFIRS